MVQWCNGSKVLWNNDGFTDRAINLSMTHYVIAKYLLFLYNY